MPVLKKDLDISPPGLLDADCSEGKTNRRWFALYTKPRQEKILMRHLHTLHKSFCGLLVPHRSCMPSGRISTSHIPLFPGYVFLFGTDVDRYDALCTHCVIDVLPVWDQQSLQLDLRKIYSAILSGREVSRASKLEQGQMVRVVAGPLTGLTGVFLKRKGRSRLLLNLAFIQQGAMVEVDDTWIEAA